MEWELAEETEVLGKNLPYYSFVHHKSQMIWRRLETWPPWWKAGDYTPEPYHGPSLPMANLTTNLNLLWGCEFMQQYLDFPLCILTPEEEEHVNMLCFLQCILANSGRKFYCRLPPRVSVCRITIKDLTISCQMLCNYPYYINSSVEINNSTIQQIADKLGFR
jgi:hypothetical protein